MGLPSFHRIELEETDCCVCGVVFAVPEHMIREARRAAGNIHCPNGHCLTWKETESAKLRRELDAETKRKNMALARANEAEAAREKAEKALDRLQKRQRVGLCPCCHRTFANVARHMASKHPEKS